MWVLFPMHFSKYNIYGYLLKLNLNSVPYVISQEIFWTFKLLRFFFKFWFCKKLEINFWDQSKVQWGSIKFAKYVTIILSRKVEFPANTENQNSINNIAWVKVGPWPQISAISQELKFCAPMSYCNSKA